MYQKKTMAILIVLLVLVITGAIGYFVWTQKSPTANWQTYKNDKYGFEFKYPKGTAIKEGENFIQIDATGGSYFWKITSFDNTQEKDLRDWFLGFFDKMANKDCNFLDSNIKISNYKTLLISAVSMEEFCDDGGYYTISDDKSKIIKLGNLGQDGKEYLLEILSTFKFTK